MTDLNCHPICVLCSTVPAHVYTVKVAANTGGGRGPFSDNVYVYVPGAGEFSYFCCIAILLYNTDNQDTHTLLAP